jgi:hypothetical protein
MQKKRPRRSLATLAACLMIMGLLLTMAADVKADGGEPISFQTIDRVPLGDFQLDLYLREDLGPEDVGSKPIVEINNTAEIIGYTGPGGRIIIPSIVQYPSEGIQPLDPPEDMDEPLGIRENVIRVSSIAAEAFKGRTDIVSITIPEGVDKIGADAFSGCTNLVELLFLGSTMPGNVSEFWLDGTPEGLQGFASYCPSISFLGTDFHGLIVFNFGSPLMGGFDMGPPQAQIKTASRCLESS